VAATGDGTVSARNLVPRGAAVALTLPSAEAAGSPR
jgi:hypothetical protein